MRLAVLHGDDPIVTFGRATDKRTRHVGTPVPFVSCPLCAIFMAPQRSRAPQEDSRSESSSTKEKQASLAQGVSHKGRRTTSGAPGNASHLKDMAVVLSAADAGPVQQDSPGGVWPPFLRSTLHMYSRPY
jgi:hypothetical protein